MPCMGSVAAKIRGSNASGVPAFVSIPRLMRFGGAAYLGKRFNPFETVSDPANGKFEVNNLTLEASLNMDRLSERRTLLSELDHAQRLADSQGVAESLDHVTREAFELVTGDRARRAFDLESEKATVRDAYGRSSAGQGMLLARRLVEAGVTVVTVRVGGWDDHA